MKRLITEFIHDQYKNNKLKGYINGSTVSVDLTGFTVMTEKLMKQGVGGAEILSDIINSVFNRAVSTVYLNGGYVTSIERFWEIQVLSMKNSVVIRQL